MFWGESAGLGRAMPTIFHHLISGRTIWIVPDG
jgi:hypothetical protein